MRVSVIIPAYNEEKCIERALRAVSGSDVESIVVCNGCTDNTEAIARKFADKVYVLEEANVSKARNFGASRASSDRLVFLDADIVVDKDVLGRVADSGYEVGTCMVRPDVRRLKYSVVMGVKSYAHWLGCCTGLMFCDRDVFVRAGGFDENRVAGEDGALLRAMRKMGSYGVVSAYVYNNMRRYEKKSLAGMSWFWVRHHLFRRVRERYEVIR